MKKTAITFLFLALPAAFPAQRAKAADSKVSVSTAASAAVKTGQAAEIIPVIAPGPVKVKAPAAAKPAVPAAAKSTAAPAAKVAAAPAAAQPKPAAAPLPQPAAKPAVAPAAKAVAAAPAAAPKTSSSAGLVIKPGAIRVQPKEQPKGGFSVGKKHTVTKGDTLWDISGKYYRNPFMWGKIYNANYKTVANPDLINPREELYIPDMDEVVLPYRRPDPAAATISDNIAEAYDAQFDEENAANKRASAARKAAMAAPGELLTDMDSGYLSEEMPEDQKEWGDGIRVVPDSWQEDGVITAKLKSENDFQDEGVSFIGETLEITLEREGSVRAGDYLAVYLKGTDAYDKDGNRLGREIQPAGLAEVFSADGYTVKARVIDATTAIYKGYIVKKK